MEQIGNSVRNCSRSVFLFHVFLKDLFYPPEWRSGNERKNSSENDSGKIPLKVIRPTEWVVRAVLSEYIYLLFRQIESFGTFFFAFDEFFF